MTNKFENKCLQKFYVFKKNGTLHANDTTNPFGYKLGESTENKKALLFFSGKETIQTFNGSI